MNPSKPRGAGRLPAWQRISTHLILAACALSGLLFFVRHELHVELMGVQAHDFLVAHGVSSAFALLAFGAIIPGHLRAAWMARRNRASGIVMIAVMSVLMLSGLLLYYGSEEVRDGVVLTHWVVGFAAFAVFILHLLLGRSAGSPSSSRPG